jgi:hypothetical protein
LEADARQRFRLEASTLNMSKTKHDRRRDQVDSFFERCTLSGEKRVRAMLLWLHVQQCSRWPTTDGSDNTAETVSHFINRLSTVIGEDNAVEFRLRFL